MKFTLIIWVCTFLHNQCSPPIQNQHIFNNWNECVDAAYDYSIKFLAQQNKDEVNDLRLATKFVCKEIDSV